MSGVSIYFAPELDLRVKSYDHLNILRASVCQFRASLYVMRLNRTSKWKVMTNWYSREVPLLNLKCLDMLYAWIGPPSEKLWPFEYLESFRCAISSVSICDPPESDLWVKSYDHLNISRAFVAQFQASRYFIRLNRTSEWKVMTMWISWELPLFNLDLLCAWIGPTSEKLRPFELLKSFHCSISSFSTSDAPESDLRVKSYNHMKMSRAYVVQFWASLYVMRLNRTSELKVMTIWFSQELPFFNFEHLYMWCAWIGSPSEK